MPVKHQTRKSQNSSSLSQPKWFNFQSIHKNPIELKTELSKVGKFQPLSHVVTTTGDSQTNLLALPIPTKREDSFECVVKVGNDELTVSGISLELVKTAKIVLHEFFNICPPEDAIMESPPPDLNEKSFRACRKNISGGSSKSTDSDTGTLNLFKPEISYGKQELMTMSKSPLCKVTPNTFD